MAVTPKPAFTVDAAVGTAFIATSSAVALPGTLAGDTVVRVANLGPCAVVVKLGTSAAVTVTQSTGVAILAGDVEYLAINGNTYIAGCSVGGPGSSTVNICTGN
jgi:hypothetical protein